MLFFKQKEVECGNCHKNAAPATNKLGYCAECYRFVFAIDPAYMDKRKPFDFKKAFTQAAPAGAKGGPQ